MNLPDHKTKIVATIGPASDSVEVLVEMIRAGMDVARINFSHGEFDGHGVAIGRVREAAELAGRRVAIMADLPGPKMRVGDVERAVELQPGDSLALTTEEIIGTGDRVSVTFHDLPRVVKAGDSLYLNDGIIHLEVDRIEGVDVHCRVKVGGILSSRKGLNMPGIDLGISAFTDNDEDCLRFAFDNGITIFSQSFVEDEGDISALRSAAAAMGIIPFVIAKIERARALENIDDIIAASDAIMIARGDLGVEIPIQRIAVVQKELMEKANIAGKPVITATQMLESMVDHNRPTRAEATDVANAILDGTHCVMLSAESAVGKFPVESIRMLAKIAAETEPHRPGFRLKEALESYGRDGDVSQMDLIALAVHYTIERVRPAVVLVPTRSGDMARNISRFKLPAWITAVSPLEETCQTLQLSYGVHAILDQLPQDDWKSYARQLVKKLRVEGDLVLLTEGPSSENPHANHRMDIIELDR
ncbi:pyruvate kinase [bacterium]|nr:pyruvate kinase [bacterium]